MKSLQFFINEKLQINKDTKIKFTLDDSIKDHIIEIIYTFCQLFKGVNKFFDNSNISKSIKTGIIDNPHTQEVIESLIYFFNKLKDDDISKKDIEQFIEILKKYPNTDYKEDIDKCIVKGFKKYKNKK